MKFARYLVTHPDIWPHASDDLADINTYQPVTGDGLYWLAVIKDGQLGGAFFVHRLNAAMYECHTCLLRGFRGATAVEAARTAVDWVFANTDCESLITHVPEYNFPAKRLAEKAGFTHIGTIPRGWKRGTVQNLHLLGVSRCQQQAE